MPNAYQPTPGAGLYTSSHENSFVSVAAFSTVGVNPPVEDQSFISEVTENPIIGKEDIYNVAEAVSAFIKECGVVLPEDSLALAFLQHRLALGVGVDPQFFLNYNAREQLLNSPVGVACEEYGLKAPNLNITAFRRIYKGYKHAEEDAGNKVAGAYALVEVAGRLTKNTHKEEARLALSTVIDEVLVTNSVEGLNLMLKARELGVNGFSDEYVYQVVAQNPILTVLYDDLLAFLPCVNFEGGLGVLDLVKLYQIGGNSELILYPNLILYFTNTLVEHGVLKLADSGELTQGRNFTGNISWAKVEKARLVQAAVRPFANDAKCDGCPTSMEGVRAIYEAKKHDFITIPNIDEQQVLFISEVFFGNRDTDLALLQKIIEYLRGLTEKPKIIVLSDLLEGDKKFRKVKERVGVVEGMRSMTAQFSSAKALLNELRAACPGTELVYVLSQTDLDIIDEYTLIVMKMLRELSKGSTSGAVADEFTAYYAANQLRTSEGWDVHLAFQTNIAYPYCISMGRALLSADEISELTVGRYEIEEYLILYEVARFVRGEIDHINPDYLDLVSLELVRALLNKQPYQDFVYTQGLQLGDTVVRSSFSATSDSGNNAKLTGLLKAAANGPGSLRYAVLGNNGPFFADGLIATGTFIRGDLTSSPTYKNKRAAKTRFGATPSTFSYRECGGVYRGTVYTDDFLRIADETKGNPRGCILNITDTHTGSVSSDLALFVRALDILRDRIQEYPSLLLLLGDFIQGQNFDTNNYENAATRLPRIRDQQAMFIELMRFFMRSLGDNTQNIEKVLLTIGNHEWNSGYKRTGDTYSAGLSLFLEQFLPKHNIIDAQALTTPTGSYVRTFAAATHFGGSKIWAKHTIADRGARGGIPSLPISQIQTLYTAEPGMILPGDLTFHGHFHRLQQLLYRGVLGSIVPSTCSRTTGYELGLGYRSDPGVLVTYVGGGEPPEWEHIPFNVLARHKVGGIMDLTDEFLADNYSLVDDAGFDHLVHSMYGPGPKSALMKYILYILTEQVIYDGTTRLN